MEDKINMKNNVNEQALADYAEKQKERMKKMVVGAKDHNGYEVSEIYARGDEYVIYRIKGVPEYNALRVYIDTKVEEDEIIIQHYYEIKDELDKVKFEIYRTGVDQSYNLRVAHAIPIALRKNPEEAKKLLKSISDDAIEEYKNRQEGRLFYMLGALSVSVLTSLVALVTYWNRVDAVVIQNQALALFIYAIAFASFGGLLSISMRLKELTLEKVFASKMYLAYGSLRQLFSILGGISVVILINADFAFSIASDNIYAILSLCLLAGFSETLVPNALRKIENDRA